MKKQEFVQIKGLDVKELKNKVKILGDEIANLVLDKNMKKLKDLKIISKKRKERAQFLTVARQKELLEELELKVQKDSEKLREPEKPESQKVRKSDTPKLRFSEAQSPSGKSKSLVKKGDRK